MDDLQALRHTLAHILALALQTTYSDKVQFGTGPATENGFYYDVHFEGVSVNLDDLAKLEAEMTKIVKQNLEVKHFDKPIAEALKWAKDSKQPFKAELITDLQADGEKSVSFYQIGDFIDLCKGPHLGRTGEVPLGSFALNKVGGAYWRADETRDQMTRISGLAFATADDLAAYQSMIKEAEKRDHRKLGRELDLFCYSKLVGSGLPLFTPRGTILRDKLNELSQMYRLRESYCKVCIPHIANLELYKVSGHYEKFPELLKFTSEESGDELALKPVSCPHHSQIYASVPRSYKELPVKLLETTMVYRDEKKGELGGLTRVRAITQDDSHVFCTEEQIGGVFGELVQGAKELYALMDMQLKLRLSFRDDGDGYIGDPKMWNKAETAIETMAKSFDLEYSIGIGEAAMYGPKMDFMAIDALGREWQLATVQLDYALPERFDLEYVDSDGKKKRPVMIHAALLGSLERFMSIFIEHTAGHFPLWCAPEQVRVITVNDSAVAYANQVANILRGVVLDQPLKYNELRFSLDTAKDNLSKKIKRTLELKIPVLIIVGARDAEAGQVVVRTGAEEQTIKLNELAEFLVGLSVQGKPER
jgi:threonyl-tRNA synthetase